MRIMERCISLRDVPPDYTYYGIASPWLQVGWQGWGGAAGWGWGGGLSTHPIDGEKSRLGVCRCCRPFNHPPALVLAWLLQAKVLRCLQYFPVPTTEAGQQQLHNLLQALFKGGW